MKQIKIQMFGWGEHSVGGWFGIITSLKHLQAFIHLVKATRTRQPQ